MSKQTRLPHRLNVPRGELHITLAGCGGTGSMVAEHLCRMLTGSPAKLVLADPDTVEERNLLRQNFRREEVGINKAEALARRLAREHRRTVGYVPEPVGTILGRHDRPGLLICCLDGQGGRAEVNREMEDWSGPTPWVVDSGNGRDSGQVLVGNTHVPGRSRPFSGGVCTALPMPGQQQPGLLAPEPEEPRLDLDCARAVELREQGPLMNAAMAVAVAETAHRIITGRCRTMSVYVDLLRGRTKTVAATPENAARIWGVSDPETLVSEEGSENEVYERYC